MATNEVLYKDGSQWLFADHATDFGAAPATAANTLILGTPTDIQIDCGSVAASGSARQSAKSGSFARTGSAYADELVLGACVENATAPTAGGTIDFYWSGSHSATAATGNAGGTTGSDAAYTLDPDRQLKYIGSLVVENQTTNIDTYIGILRPAHLYGCLVVVNNTDQNCATTADEIHAVLTERIPDIQASA